MGYLMRGKLVFPHPAYHYGCKAECCYFKKILQGNRQGQFELVKHFTQAYCVPWGKSDEPAVFFYAEKYDNEDNGPEYSGNESGPCGPGDT